MMKYSEYIKESVKTNPLDTDPSKPFAVSTWVKTNYDDFLEGVYKEFETLIGKEIYFEGERRYAGRESPSEKDKTYRINGKIIRNCYRAKIKGIKTYGTNHKTLLVTTEDNKIYQVYKILNKKEYDKFFEKIKKEEERQEMLENSVGKTIYFNGSRYRKIDYYGRYGSKKQDDEDKPFIINDKLVNTVYKVDVAKIEDTGRGRYKVTDDMGREYIITKLLDKKSYDRFVKRVGAELQKREEIKRKKEEFKIKIRDIDPYDEEDWFEEVPDKNKWY